LCRSFKDSRSPSFCTKPSLLKSSVPSPWKRVTAYSCISCMKAFDVPTPEEQIQKP
jgi:hypothetical protein